MSFEGNDGGTNGMQRRIVEVVGFQASSPIVRSTWRPVTLDSLAPRRLGRPTIANFSVQPFASRSEPQARPHRARHERRKNPRPRGRPIILREVRSAQRLRKEGRWSEAKQLLEGVRQQAERDPNYKNEVLHVRAAQLRQVNPSISPVQLYEELFKMSESIPATSNATTFNAMLLGLRDSRALRQSDLKDDSDSDLEVALRIFDTMLEKQINPDHYTMSILFQMCAFSRSSHYLEIFETKAKDLFRFQPNAISGSALLSACAKCGVMESFERVLDDLQARKIPLNERAYASVISAYHRAGLHSKVMHSYQVAINSDSVNPNIFIFSGAVASCCKARDAANSRLVFDGMMRTNTDPNEEVLVTLLETALRTGDIQLGHDVLFEWGPRYRLCRPTLQRISRLVHASKKSSTPATTTLELVKTIMRRMVEETDLKPDVTMLNSCISTFIGLGSITDARDVLENWFSKFGYNPDVVTYNVLIHSLGRARRAGVALRMWEVMLQSGVRPDLVSYNSMLDVLIQCGKVEEAVKLNEEMRKVPGMKTDATRVLLELKIYRITKDAEPAMALFRSCIKEGNTLDAKTHGLLLTVLFEARRADEAISVFGWLVWKRLATAVVCNVVLDYTGRVERYQGVCLGILEGMKRKGIVSDEITYSIVIRICSRNGRIDKAFRLLGEMQDVGLGLTDTYAWTALIDGCGRVGQWQRAVELLKAMRDAEGTLALIPAPTTHCYNAAIYAGSMRGGGWKVAVEVYEMLREDDGQEADAVTYSAMASSILANRHEIQEWSIVKEVYDKLREAVIGNGDGGEIDRVQQRASGSRRRMGKGEEKKLVAKLKRMEWVLGDAVKGMPRIGKRPGHAGGGGNAASGEPGMETE